ncbi:MAG: transglycosylase SLT domain-containing protein [Gemmatimonadota bacterium]|uniref:transglycosylase SLT domain-containing protein n=1 Tax=Candidatus Palauibacter scopulicola TaxID=3056741 RepID=UPI00238E2134|nr:transglycosylase SLT domain-containing protein [Candidatus Palauibacter scopulicola]MDE2662786.1 transglycosylase SLT domain-containing protein [Candidatus Palauibacter scopulicola]
MHVQRRIRRLVRIHGLRAPWLGSLLTLALTSALAAQAGSAARAPGPGQVAAMSADADVLERARRLLEARMPVSASALLAPALAAGEVEGDEAVLLAARAFADQRAWASVLDLLSERESWPPSAPSQATVLLARAYAGLDSLTRSAAHYRAYLSGIDGTPPLRARVEFARVSYRRYQWYEARDQLALAEGEHPELASWLRLSRLYALAEAEDRDAFALADSIVREARVPADSARLPAARLAFKLEDPERGAALASRAGQGVRNVLAARHLGPHYLAVGDSASAASAFADAIRRGLQTPETGPALLALTRSWRTLRDVGRSDTRAGRHSRGAGYLAEALELAPAAERPGIAESLASAYMALGAPARAAEALAPWTGDPASVAAPRASLWMLAASIYRALGRHGDADEARETAARGSGDVAARAAYLIADLEHDAGRPDIAAEGFERSYRAFPDASYGTRSLERLALLAYHEGRYEEARMLLAEYRERYPEGEWVQGAIYWGGKVAEALGDTQGASAFYARALRYSPLDYYAILAEPRTGTDRLAAVGIGDGEPLPDLDPIHATALRRMNVLREVGWPERARREYRRASERGPGTYGAILAFAHALNDAEWTREGIREGWRAQSIRGRWTRPLLEAIYPLPFREALVAAAERNGLPPHFVAGLSRRESMFDPEIRSVANAIGLMQLLPETARNVSSRAGLAGYRRHQLTVPQVNLMLGTRYLSEVLGRFDGFDIAGMISYNAGPHRYTRWRDFPEFADDEKLVERIPYRETREYVRAVTELAEIYRFLYPDLGVPNP